MTHHNPLPFLPYIMLQHWQIFSHIVFRENVTQLHVERTPGEAIHQHAHQHLMRTACASRMKLPSLTLDHPFQVSNCLSDFDLFSVVYKFIHVNLSCQKVKYVERSGVKSYDSRANRNFCFKVSFKFALKKSLWQQYKFIFSILTEGPPYLRNGTVQISFASRSLMLM